MLILPTEDMTDETELLLPCSSVNVQCVVSSERKTTHTLNWPTNLVKLF